MTLASYKLQNEFVGPLETYDFHIISSAPQEINGYLALVGIFDPFTWVLLLVSVLMMTIALITVNKLHSTWLDISPKETPYQSIIRHS